MIDRKSLRIFGLFLLVMIAAAAWRISLPDWRLSAAGPTRHDLFDGLALFLAPASLLLFLVAPFIQWLAAPEETLPSLRRTNGKVIVAWSLFWTLFQVFVLLRSLGVISPPSSLDLARGGSVMIGIVFMITGNFLPKTPVPHQCDRSQRDPWETSRAYRFLSRLFVALGLAFVLGGLLLPLELWEPVFTCLMLAALAAGFWFVIKLRRERSLQ